ncbi:MAG: hypothetical protein NXH72_15280 [Hyphomonadaceae bacterium]|nr:hypothetical protein [Hyphomonadaceae bacterium]
MSQIRMAVIGADELDPEHHIALNRLTETGRIAAYALDAAPTAEGFAQLENAIVRDRIEALVIAGARTELAPWLTFALPRGWPIYSTHPVPSTVEEMIDIRRAEQSVTRPVLEFGMTFRHHESVVTALNKAGSGEYGALLSVRAICGVAGSTGDILFEFGAQMLDLLHAFAGPFQDIGGFADLDRTETPGSETNVLATLRTHAGTLASLHVSATQWRPTFRLELGFERGYLWLEGLNVDQNYFGQETLIYARTGGEGAQHEMVERFDQSNGALSALQHFLDRVANPAVAAATNSQQAFDTLNTLHRILAADPIYAPIQERHVS